jgi:hypothetical protein
MSRRGQEHTIKHSWETPFGFTLRHHPPGSSTLANSQIPPILPGLPPAADLPWSAEVVEAHRGLTSAFNISRAALNLDESDPIRLGHHLQRAETFMLSIIEVLGLQTVNPLPPEYIEALRSAVLLLVEGLRIAMREATAAFVASFTNCSASQLIVYFAVRAPKYHILR